MINYEDSTMKFIAMITRTLKPGKTYDDFRQAWFHTTGFGIPSTMYTAINVANPREIFSIGILDGKMVELLQALQIDVKDRLANPLDDVIESTIIHQFGVVTAVDDFSLVGELTYMPASVDGVETDYAQIASDLVRINQEIAHASAIRDQRRLISYKSKDGAIQTMGFNQVAIIGASGAIGGALVRHIASCYPNAMIHAFSRGEVDENVPNVLYKPMDYTDESAIEKAALSASKTALFDLVIIATGILHEGGMQPEKSLRALSADHLQRVFEVNTVIPALLMKHFLPRLGKKNRAVLAVLSARVGSISDNRLGGWYAYRAAKAALNMMVKNASIEIKRTHPHAMIVGLHPGTVDSNLSKPFQGNVPAGKLFTPAYAAQALLKVLEALQPAQSGDCIAWDGQTILP